MILSRRRLQQEQQQQQQSTWPLPRARPQLRGSKNLASTPAEPSPPLRILDLCTGTGCIPLLLHSLLSPHIANLQILGIDTSPKAIDLARRNLAHNIAKKTLSPAAKSQIRFLGRDVRRGGRRASVDEGDGDRDAYLAEEWQIVTSNPPYISPRAFNTSTARSVRAFEPKLALVPPSGSHLQDDADSGPPSAPSIATNLGLKAEEERRANYDDSGDAFYPSILSIAHRVKAHVLVMEVGDMPQAERVAALGLAPALASTEAEDEERKGWEEVVIWRDWIDQHPPQPGAGAGKGGGSVSGTDIAVLGGGDGAGRAVVCFRGCL